MNYISLVRPGKKGQRIMNKLKRQYQIGTGDRIVLLPETTPKRFSTVSNCIRECKKKDKESRFILIAENMNMQNRKKMDSGDYGNTLIWVSKTEMQYLIKYQMLYRKHDYIIASLKWPEGRHMDRLLGVGGVTEEKVIRAVLFRLEFKEDNVGQVSV